MTDQDGSAWYALRCIFRCGWPPKLAGRAFEERIRRFEICIDANDPAVLRPFWRTALGYMDEQTPEGAVDLVDPAGVLPTVWFQKVPEVKTSKNRMHLDVSVQTQERERLVEALVALGGTVVATYPRFTTLADPEGNELCVTTQ